MKKYLIALIGLLLLIGCNRTYDSKSLGFDSPEEPPAPIGLRAFHLDSGLEINWAIRDTAAVAYFKIYYAGQSSEDFLLWDTTSAFSDTITALTEGQTYLFQIAAVGSDGTESSPSTSITAGLGVTTVSINNDDEYTNDTDVSLRFVLPSTASLMKLSEDSAGATASWRSFTQSASFAFGNGDGVKKVFARFRFSDGSESKEPVSDTIVLDTRAFIDSVWFTTNASNPAVGDTVMFYLESSEAGGGATIGFPGVSSLELYDDGSGADATADDGIYSRRYIIPLNLTVTNGLVSGEFTDRAGNDANSVPATDRLDIVELFDPITLKAVAEASYNIRLDWSEVDSDDFVSYRIYRATSSGVDDTSELIELITSQSTVTYNDEDVDEASTYYYRVYAYGSSGELASSSEESAVTPSNTAPETVSLGLSIGSADGLQINLTWTASDAEDFASYRIYRADFTPFTDATGQSLAVIDNQNTTTYTDYRANISDTYYYIILVYDRQGAKSPQSLIVATP